METIEATYRIVTPMFIGGAGHEATCIRPPSFKGALRFWWRALNWGRLYKGDNAQALKKLHQEECRIFGGSAEKDGQGTFLLTVAQPHNLQFVSDWPNPPPQSGSGFLGFGLFPMGEHTRRQAIAEDQTFSIRLAFKPSAGNEKVSSVREALIAMGLFGGLGSRSRKGFGSVSLDTLDGKDVHCMQIDDYKKKCVEFYHSLTLPDSFPPYTALSAKAMMSCDTEKFSTARQAHASLGKIYYGIRGARDASVKGRGKIAFGLPLQGHDNDRRRTGPLFFHIHPVGDRFIGSNLFIPATFHPEYPNLNHDDFYRVVSSYMDKLEKVLL